MLQLFTDTDTDITPALAREYGYELISMPYSIDGKTTYPYVDFDRFDDHAFYDLLRGGVLPTTSALSEEQYIQYFEPVFARGDDILYVHFSRAMTATFDSMDHALEQLKEKYPERRFYEVDSKGITTVSYAVHTEHEATLCLVSFQVFAVFLRECCQVGDILEVGFGSQIVCGSVHIGAQAFHELLIRNSPIGAAQAGRISAQ